MTGVCLEVANSGELLLTGARFIDLGVYDQSLEWRTETAVAPSGSATATAAIRQVVEELDASLPEAVRQLSRT